MVATGLFCLLYISRFHLPQGDIMRVIGLHDVGWLEVEEGFMSPAWVQPVYHPEEEE